jgi:soluble lytic murein transglycosylase-like protein
MFGGVIAVGVTIGLMIGYWVMPPKSQVNFMITEAPSLAINIESLPPPSKPDPLRRWRKAPYARQIAQAAQAHDLDPALLAGLVEVESNFEPTACSPAGACGLTQLMPATAQELGVDRSLIASQLTGGAEYLSKAYQREGDWSLAFAAYNAGPEAVRQYGGIPPYPETLQYVTRVNQAWQKWNSPLKEN